MEFFAMLLSLFISGTYGQWSEVSLSTTCEDLIQPFPCPGEPKVCEHCAACVSQYFNKCKCLPASLLAESQDGATICLWALVSNWSEPECCEYYKDLFKRNSISNENGGSVRRFSDLLADVSDTQRRKSGKTGTSGTSTSVVGNHEEDVASPVANNCTDTQLTNSNTKHHNSKEKDFKNVRINKDSLAIKASKDCSEFTDSKSETEAKIANEAEAKNEAETEDDNRTGLQQRVSQEVIGNDRHHSSKTFTANNDRERRDSILMHALMLAAEDIWTDVDYKRKRR